MGVSSQNPLLSFSHNKFFIVSKFHRVWLKPWDRVSVLSLKPNKGFNRLGLKTTKKLVKKLIKKTTIKTKKTKFKLLLKLLLN